MMKKLLFLMASGFIATGAFAQQNATESVVKIRRDKGFKAEAPKQSMEAARQEEMRKSGNKTTAGGSKWYEPWTAADAYLGSQGVLESNTFVYYMGYDSTYLQTYLNGPGPVNWIGFGQFFDPTYATGFNTYNPVLYPLNSLTDIRVQPYDAYTVDSIYIRGAYMEGEDPTLGAAYFQGQIDTMIFSLTPHAYAYSNYTKANYPGVVNYLGVSQNGDVAKVINPPVLNVDSRGFTSTGAKTWKVPMDPDARRPKTAAGQYPTSTMTFEVPGGLSVPAGQGVMMSAAFKPGEAKDPTRDSVRYYNYYMYSAAKTTGGDDWAEYLFYEYNDRNMAYLMHYSGAGRFSSSIGLELVNDKDFSQEFLYTGAFISCATCKTLNIKDVNTNNVSAKAYPNPAVAEVRVPFELANQADVTVSLTNAIGQVVKVQNFAATTANTAVFNTSDLANGVYIYTVEANGQRLTGRVAVSK